MGPKQVGDSRSLMRGATRRQKAGRWPRPADSPSAGREASAFSVPEIVHHLRVFCDHIGPRPTATPNSGRATEHLVRTLEAFGLEVAQIPFDLAVALPSRAQLTTASGMVIPCLPAVGSPSTPGVLEGVPRFLPLGAPPGQHRDEAFRGALLLSPLGLTSETERAGMAAKRGVAAVLFYHEGVPELYSALIAVGEGPLPCVSIRRSDALRLMTGEEPVRLLVEGRLRSAQGINLLVRAGEAPRILLLANYDTRPGTPGASANAAAVTALLALLARTRDWKGPGFLAAFLDAEELGRTGSLALHEALRAKGWLDDLTGVVYLDGLGTKAVTILSSEEGAKVPPLARAILKAFEHQGLLATRPLLPSERLVFPTDLWRQPIAAVQGPPQPARHTALDHVDLIDPESLDRTAEALRRFLEDRAVQRDIPWRSERPTVTR